MVNGNGHGSGRLGVRSIQLISKRFGGFSFFRGSMKCGSSISNDGYGQDRYRIMAILAQDANTDRKEKVPLSEPWDYQHLGELTRDGCCGLWPKWLRMPRLLGAAASRGLQSGHAPHVWQSGYRSGASIQALSTARLHQGSCPSRQSRRRFGR